MRAIRARSMEVTLAIGFAVAGSLLLWQTVDPELRALTGAGAGAAATVLFLLPAMIDGLTLGRLAVVCALAAVLAFTLALAAPAPGASAATAAALGTMAALITGLAGSIGRLVAPASEDGHAAIAWPAAGLMVLAAAPVWLGPVIDRTEPAQWVTDAVIAVSPLTHLALPAEVDYLRSDWFYRHAPFGGVRYDYPSAAAVAGGYLLACVLAWIVTIRRRRTTTGPRGREWLTHPHAEATSLNLRRSMMQTWQRLLTASSLCLALLPGGIFAAEPAMDPALASKAERAVDEGLHYLRGTQAEDGSWSKSVGVTALALRAFLESHRGYNEEDGAFITRPVKFLLDHINEDGSISETSQNRSYNTAVAMVALQATKNPAYAEVIKNAQRYTKGHQIDEQEGYEPSHKYYGGIGYGGDERPDLSNLYMAVEALKATDFDPKDPLWQKALVFISRSQNNSETNDQAFAGNDGGFAYMPGYSPHGEAVSYGGMTSAGLLSLLFAGADKNDPRVQAAYDWIRANYTLDTNPGAEENQGLFYYYNVFSKAMAAYGEPQVTDTAGGEHNWRNDLATKLLSLQDEDGSWVNTHSKRWWEGDRNLVTAWSVIALNTALEE